MKDDDTAGQKLIYAYRLVEQGWYDELEAQMQSLAHVKSHSRAAYLLLQSLVYYAKDQDLTRAAQALEQAYRSNPQVADYLLVNAVGKSSTRIRNAGRRHRRRSPMDNVDFDRGNAIGRRFLALDARYHRLQSPDGQTFRGLS